MKQTKQQDRRLYETGSRAEVLECTACKSRPSSAARRSRVSQPIQQPPSQSKSAPGSIWTHPGSICGVLASSTVITSWRERWRLATVILPTKAAGGSDPCTGSTLIISRQRGPSGPLDLPRPSLAQARLAPAVGIEHPDPKLRVF